MSSHQLEQPGAALADWQRVVDDAIADLVERRVVDRIWARDPTLWHADPEHQREIRERLGWLTVVGAMRERVADLQAFAQDVRAAGIEHVVLCGMGGSSLCPEVLRLTFGNAPGYPHLWVLDSTDPTTVAQVADQAPPDRTLHVIASKSGGTIEIDSLNRFFFERAQAALGDRAGAHFCAITDPGTSLERLGQERGFRRVFLNPPDIGGRYSALSLFGLVPAALLGLDLDRLLDRAQAMVEACSADAPGAANPGLWLGAALGALAQAGRDKLTLLTSPRLSGFGLWVEQLIAESTGKEGRGIVPIAGEPPGPPQVYGSDRFFVAVRLADDDNAELDQLLADLTAAGQPCAMLHLTDAYDLGAEFFRWEFATAVAGVILRVDVFDQPNVQESKDNTGRILADYRETGRLPDEPADVIEGPLKISGAKGANLPDVLAAFLRQARPGDYVALLAYLPMTEATDRALNDIRRRIRDRTRLATTLGYGPRFLHSTGQLHKGGPNTGLFLQLTADDAIRVAIPGQPYDFGTLKAAQAVGDHQALERHGRRALAIHLGTDVADGLARLARAVGGE